MSGSICRWRAATLQGEVVCRRQVCQDFTERDEKRKARVTDPAQAPRPQSSNTTASRYTLRVYASSVLRCTASMGVLRLSSQHRVDICARTGRRLTFAEHPTPCILPFDLWHSIQASIKLYFTCSSSTSLRVVRWDECKTGH